MAMVIARVLVLVVGAAAGLAVGPALGLPVSPWLGAAGLGLAVLVLLLEGQARAVPLARLFWGAAGGLVGLAIGVGLGGALGALSPGAAPVARGLLGFLLGYLGVALALAKQDELAGLTARLFPGTAAAGPAPCKILDTSVIIDGRIADVCETGFLEGKLVVPRFVLRELQQIADSPDGLRRNRGKRGFEILQRLQRLPRVTLEVEDREFPQVRAVDDKLLELARTVSGTVVTNDYNLNKMAEVSGVSVLNVNDLANALKPALLPGETLRLHVLREGKEAGQGVAYLDDGTMVVVDQGKRLIGQTVDASVTSVLQTSAGRMVFARPAPGPAVGEDTR